MVTTASVRCARDEGGPGAFAYRCCGVCKYNLEKPDVPSVRIKEESEAGGRLKEGSKRRILGALETRMCYTTKGTPHPPKPPSQTSSQTDPSP